MSALVFTHGSGSWLWSACGRKLLDLTTGIGVLQLGHSHPRIAKAVAQQASTLQHLQVSVGFHKPMLDLIDALVPKVAPVMVDGDQPNEMRLTFASSGAEAVEAAIRLVRQSTGRSTLIALNGGFHGRTNGTSALSTSKYVIRVPPLMPGVAFAQAPYCSNCEIPRPVGQDCCGYPLRHLDELLAMQVPARDVAAVFIEPILGEGGYIVPPKGYMAGLRDWCTRHNVLLVIDEVQSGYGRTGKFWAIEHEGIKADVLVSAKGIASGYPLSCIVSRRALTEKEPPGSQGGTYGGNAVACAAALETLNVFRDEKILENAVAQGEFMMNGLKALKTKYPAIHDVRGRGLMLALEYDAKLKGAANRVSQASLERNMLLLTAGTREVNRLIPPLNISRAECEIALDTLEQAVKTL